MSTRYVWGKYNIVDTTAISPLTSPIVDGEGYEWYWPYDPGDADYKWMVHPDFYNSYSGNSLGASAGGTIYYSTSVKLTGRSSSCSYGAIYEAKLQNPKTATVNQLITSGSTSFTIPAGNYFCLNSDTFWIISRSYGESYASYWPSYDEDMYRDLQILIAYDFTDQDGSEIMKPEVIMGAYAQSSFTWTCTKKTYSYEDSCNDNVLRCPIVTGGISQGSLVSYLSSSSNTAYSSGISGSYWYEYKTQGSIDPTAVSITTNPLFTGSSATISVTPRTNYYGTTSYLYQYKANSGSWTNIATSSATSYNFTIPNGTTTIQVRARAQDNIGFTSTDYVTSSSYTVKQGSTTYVGASGAVRTASVKTGVSGAVRSANPKKGVNGVVKS